MRQLAFIIFTSIAFLPASPGFSQYNHDRPEPELSMGVDIVAGKLYYGKSSLFVTDPGSISIGAMLRYDQPLQLFPKAKREKYIDVIFQGGFLFCKANNFDTTYTDPVMGFIHDRSSNPSYMPFHAGVYNRGKISIGSELFYGLGLGNRDIWGAKFISVGYNGSGIRVNAAAEYYAQVRRSSQSGILYSFNFLVKLIRGGK